MPPLSRRLSPFQRPTCLLCASIINGRLFLSFSPTRYALNSFLRSVFSAFYSTVAYFCNKKIGSTCYRFFLLHPFLDCIFIVYIPCTRRKIPRRSPAPQSHRMPPPLSRPWAAPVRQRPRAVRNKHTARDNAALR